MLVKIFSIAVAVSFLLGCKKEEEFPADYFFAPVMRTKLVSLADGSTERVVDLDRSFCIKYRLIDKQEVIFDRGVKRPLLECNGIFGMDSETTPKVTQWISDVVKKKYNAMIYDSEVSHAAD